MNIPLLHLTIYGFPILYGNIFNYESVPHPIMGDGCTHTDMYILGVTLTLLEDKKGLIGSVSNANSLNMRVLTFTLIVV